MSDLQTFFFLRRRSVEDFIKPLTFSFSNIYGTEERGILAFLDICDIPIAIFDVTWIIRFSAALRPRISSGSMVPVVGILSAICAASMRGVVIFPYYNLTKS